MQCNISAPNETSKLERSIATLGPVDILINNASGWFEGPLGKMTSEEIFQVTSGTLTSAILVTRLVGEHMLRNGGGDILFLGSTAGSDLRPSLNTAFNAGKWGLRGLAKNLRREYFGTNVRVTLLSLGRLQEEDIRSTNDETVPTESVLRVIDFVLDMPRPAVVDEVVITPMGREY